MNKEQMLEDIKINKCPICKTEKSLWLDSEGIEYQSHVCQKCETEVIMEMEQVISSITLYNPETDEETILKKG